MANITLYIGAEPHVETRDIRDDAIWTSVRSQIENAMRAGYGLIEIPVMGGDKITYVYNSSLLIAWLERK